VCSRLQGDEPGVHTQLIAVTRSIGDMSGARPNYMCRSTRTHSLWDQGRVRTYPSIEPV